jgi:hypothetical protein
MGGPATPGPPASFGDAMDAAARDNARIAAQQASAQRAAQQQQAQKQAADQALARDQARAQQRRARQQQQQAASPGSQRAARAARVARRGAVVAAPPPPPNLNRGQLRRLQNARASQRMLAQMRQSQGFIASNAREAADLTRNTLEGRGRPRRGGGNAAKLAALVAAGLIAPGPLMLGTAAMYAHNRLKGGRRIARHRARGSTHKLFAP